MAEDARDILMKLEVAEGNPVPSECMALIEAGKDDLADGFTAQPLRGGRKVNYFSIDDFTFPVGLIDSDVGENDSQKQMRDIHEQMAKFHQMRAESEGGGKGFRPKRNVEFTRFMSNGRSAIRARSYPADLEQMSVTKKMDASSSSIFDLCKNSRTLYCATILKRKAVGEQSLRGYLRIDFYDVLITDLSWDNDEVVKEEFKFVCREARVKYCMESFSTDASPAGQAKLLPMPEKTWSVLGKK